MNDENVDLTRPKELAHMPKRTKKGTRTSLRGIDLLNYRKTRFTAAFQIGGPARARDENPMPATMKGDRDVVGIVS
jgi:hypothetical protein